MAVLNDIPEQEQTQDQPPLLIELQADFDGAGQFGHQTLQVSREWVRVLEPSGTPSFHIPIAEIRTARNEPLVGGGRLEVTTTSGEIISVVTYSQSAAAQFSEAARGIEQLAKGEPLAVTLKTERTRCQKCDRLLPEKDGICPNCVNRGKVLMRIAGFLTPYKKQAAALAVLSVLTTGLNLIPPKIQQALIDGVLSTHRNLGHLYFLMGAWFAMLCGAVIVQILTGRTIAFLGGHIAADLRSRVFRSIEFLPLSYFDKKQVGAITSRVTQDTDRVWGFLVDGLPYLVIQFWAVNAYLSLIYGPLQWFAQVNNWFSRAMAGAERIFEVMDTQAEKYGLPNTSGREIEGTVEFDNVRFGYDKSNPVLKDLTFTAKPGEMIGLVGKSGAGKSTTINLICRFYEPDSGSLKIDGIDYREIDLQDLRRQIGVVLQEPFLFNGTIAENIAYGKPGASFANVIEAAKAANAHSFILGKPDGYDTMVGERGAKLSGGERQRISIARAILHDPRILILDEATSSVDVETEKQIQGAIARLIQGRTTFAIAHRLSTLRNADRLIVMDKGQIAEMGTHAELMEKKGEFFKLVETQSAVTQIIGVA